MTFRRTILVIFIICIVITIILIHFEDDTLFQNATIPKNTIIQTISSSINNQTTTKTTANPTQSPSISTSIPIPTPKIKGKRAKYSSFVCLGGDTNHKVNNYRKQFGSFLQHTCHFKNICYSNKLDKFLYYAPSANNNSMHQIIQTEQQRIYYDFNTTKHGFLMIHSMHDVHIDPVIINKPFPDSTNIHKLFHKTVIYHYLQWVYNFGHVLTDNFYAMYRALNYFHLYPNNTCCQPLFNYKWSSTGFEDKGSVSLPVKFINGLNEYIFNGTQPIFLGFDSRKNHGRSAAVEAEYERLFAFNDTSNDLGTIFVAQTARFRQKCDIVKRIVFTFQ